MSTVAAAPRTSLWQRLRSWLQRPARLFAGDRPPATADLQLDLERPALFTKYPDLLEPDELILEIRRRIDELYAAGSIDEGTPQTLDRWIQSMRVLWEYRIELEHLERRRTRAYASASLRSRTTAQAARITELEQRLAVVDRALQTEQRRPGDRRRKGSS